MALPEAGAERRKLEAPSVPPKAQGPESDAPGPLRSSKRRGSWEAGAHLSGAAARRCAPRRPSSPAPRPQALLLSLGASGSRSPPGPEGAPAGLQAPSPGPSSRRAAGPAPRPSGRTYPVGPRCSGLARGFLGGRDGRGGGDGRGGRGAARGQERTVGPARAAGLGPGRDPCPGSPRNVSRNRRVRLGLITREVRGPGKQLGRRGEGRAGGALGAPGPPPLLHAPIPFRDVESGLGGAQGPPRQVRPSGLAPGPRNERSPPGKEKPTQWETGGGPWARPGMDRVQPPGARASRRGRWGGPQWEARGAPEPGSGRLRGHLKPPSSAPRSPAPSSPRRLGQGLRERKGEGPGAPATPPYGWAPKREAEGRGGRSPIHPGWRSAPNGGHFLERLLLDMASCSQDCSSFISDLGGGGRSLSGRSGWMTERRGGECLFLLYPLVPGRSWKTWPFEGCGESPLRPARARSAARAHDGSLPGARLAPCGRQLLSGHGS
ncbi:collagen alpha-1(I) chain-like [Sarcophilus harrisii]|uniref:collagen alpha-1(I) chain-like n=1 Tax=Sarcophilus harrisii TaxID=9305 RepID=UPI001301A1C9|nr:collagen alpha-1(I) chain-like [Sarcophilus harrisii]